MRARHIIAVVAILVKTGHSDGALASTATIFVAALRAIFRLPATWRQRIRFRAQLRADMVDAADFLHDIGIDLFDAQAEALRFFWEPITLMRVQSTSPEVAPGLATDVDLRSDARMRRADIARAAQLESKADLEVS
ncbi:uncharacterized protein YjiS (DUF1127 family) [Nitrobacteraceae bacterium AZCC 2161]|jgi:uncharacterized protein YjiS (DUF1127 family)